MKKLLLVFIAFLALTLFAPTEVSFAQGMGQNFNDITGASGAVPDGGFFLPDAGEFGEIGEHESARLYIVTVLNFILSFLGIIGMIFIIYAGYLYVTAGGDDAQHEKSKKIIIFVVAGILVVLVSYALVNTLIIHAPAGTDDRDGPTTGSSDDGGRGGSNISTGGGTPDGGGQRRVPVGGGSGDFTQDVPDRRGGR
jgi:hypothetical protein